jgi:hypothetical protein
MSHGFDQIRRRTCRRKERCDQMDLAEIRAKVRQRKDFEDLKNHTFIRTIVCAK